MAFSGEYPVRVDKNNRVKLPIPFQTGFGQRFYIIGLEVWGFMTLYPETRFNQMMEGLDNAASPLDPVFIHLLPRLGASSFEVIVGDRGRFTIPPKLQLFVSPAMVFIGAGRTVRLHKENHWQEGAKQGNISLQMWADRLAGGV